MILILGDVAFRFPAADLLVEGVDQLLTGGGAGECGALEQRATETALIAETFGRSVKCHAQTIHQIDDARRAVTHFLDGRLMLKEVTAIDRVVKVKIFAISLCTGHFVDRVDTTLSANAMGPLHGYQADQMNVRTVSG